MKIIALVFLIAFSGTLLGQKNADNPIHPWDALQPGDKVAIIAPSRGCKSEADLQRVEELISSLKFKPYVPECALPDRKQGKLHFAPKYSASGYGNTATKRAECIDALMRDSEIKALVAIRGGQGACEIVSKLEGLVDDIPADFDQWIPKPIIGFSDVTALHMLFNAHGIPTIHGPLALYHQDTPDLSENWILNNKSDYAKLAEVLTNPEAGGHIKLEAINQKAKDTAEIQGRLSGGNMLGLSTAVGTPSDIPDNAILLVEDVGENAEKIIRHMIQVLRAMKKNGKTIQAIVFGDFTWTIAPQLTDADKADGLKTVVEVGRKGFEEHIKALVKEFFPHIPCYRSLEFGHGPVNLFLPLGVSARIENDSELRLVFDSFNGK